MQRNIYWQTHFLSQFAPKTITLRWDDLFRDYTLAIVLYNIWRASIDWPNYCQFCYSCPYDYTLWLGMRLLITSIPKNQHVLPLHVAVFICLVLLKLSCFCHLIPRVFRQPDWHGTNYVLLTCSALADKRRRSDDCTHLDRRYSTTAKSFATRLR
jgi:hypothetical protein